MPLITFELGMLSEEVKAKLIIELTNTSAKITGIPKKAFLYLSVKCPIPMLPLGEKV